MKNEITYEDVKKWIVEHSDDLVLMEALNKLTYVFTRKYEEQQLRGRAE